MHRKGYNPEFMLRRADEIQQIVKTYCARGVTLKWIYENLVRDRYFISESTFKKYLGIPTKRMLRELAEAKKQKRPPE
ncbi:MAG: hypothetical protein LBH06_00865 [Rikenellaceae bacterium]|nr:hypothetical protein [Rikenellaceae bacterium]